MYDYKDEELQALIAEESQVLRAFNARRGETPRQITLEIGHAECWLAAYTHYRRTGTHDAAEALLDEAPQRTSDECDAACSAFVYKEIAQLLGIAITEVARGQHPAIGRGAMLPEPYPDFDQDIPF